MIIIIHSICIVHLQKSSKVEKLNKQKIKWFQYTFCSEWCVLWLCVLWPCGKQSTGCAAKMLWRSSSLPPDQHFYVYDVNFLLSSLLPSVLLFLFYCPHHIVFFSSLVSHCFTVTLWVSAVFQWPAKHRDCRPESCCGVIFRKFSEFYEDSLWLLQSFSFEWRCKGYFLSLSVQINFPYLKATFCFFYLKLVFLTTVRKKVTAVNDCQDCHGHTDL